MNSSEIARMFSRISSRYDLANHVLSWNLDRGWRRRLVEWAAPRPAERVLDVCTGTADLLLACACQQEPLSLWGVDLSWEMLSVGQKKLQALGCAPRALLIEADAMRLPFASETFDLVTIAFGLRNLPDIQAGLAELARVLNPKGRLLMLEFALPSRALWRRIYLFYLKQIVPRVGALLTGSREAYQYLYRSICEFPSPTEIEERMSQAGLRGVKSLPLAGGIAFLYCGER